MGTDGSPRRQQDRRKSLNAMDYWNAAFRGLSPGGWQQKPPVATDAGDVPPFAEDVEDYVPADPLAPIQQNIVPIPVVLVEDISHTQKRVERFIIANTQQVNAINSTLIVPQNPFRTQTILNNLGPGIVYIGHNETVGAGGFSLAVNSVVVLGTTRDLWAIQQTAQTSLANVSIIQEYDKDTVEN
jgi:hypothetical protein